METIKYTLTKTFTIFVEVAETKWDCINYDSIKNIYETALKMYVDAGNPEIGNLRLLILTSYDGEMVEWWYDDETEEFKCQKIGAKTIFSIGLRHGITPVPQKIHGIKKRLDNAKNDFENALKELKEYEPEIGEYLLENRPDLCASCLKVENPLIEDNYYVGHGVILETLEDLKFAFLTGYYESDGGLRNQMIEDWQSSGRPEDMKSFIVSRKSFYRGQLLCRARGNS